MKICLLSYRGNPYCGGQGVYIHYLSRGLSNLGHEVQVLSGPPYPEVVEDVKLHKIESLNLYDSLVSPSATPPRISSPLNFCEYMAVRFGMFPEPFTFSIRAYRKLRELLSHDSIDVIHDNQCLSCGMLLVKRLKVPLVTTIHHPVTIDKAIDIAQARNWKEKFKMMRWYSFTTTQPWVSRRMDRIITVSGSSAEEIGQAFKVPQKKMRVVYNGIDSDYFKRDDSILKEPNRLIMVGGTPIKGTIYLLKALQLLRGEIETRLTIVGSSDGQHALKMVKEYGLEDMVDFTGKIDGKELVNHYSAAEVAIVPSLFEGFGFPAAEAMSCAVPLISTKAGALPEVVGPDGEAGMLVPPGEPDALAAAIKKLLADEALRRKMGEAGRKRVEENFTWEKAAKKTLEVYQELM